VVAIGRDQPIVVRVGYQPTTKSTAAEQAEVLRLREAGLSIRAIAAEVFGDARYRGRVARIGARGDAPPAGAVAPDELSLDGLATIEAIRMLFERRLAMLVSGEVAPSMTELQKLLDVQRRLDAYAQYERLRDLTREPD
jgi:hypothetical protein